MPFTVQAEAPPLREDSSGALRVGRSRVLMDLVIRAFQHGATPKAIVQRYDTLALPDVYAVIAYYLRHRGEIERYLGEREKDAQQVRQRIESQQGDLGEIRNRLQGSTSVAATKVGSASGAAPPTRERQLRSQRSYHALEYRRESSYDRNCP